MRIFALSALFVAFGTGCTPVAAVLLGAELLDGNDDSWEDASWDSGDYYADAAPITGRMRGDLGAVDGIDGAFRDSSMWWYGDSASIDLHTLDGDWAMLNGGFDASSLSEGETVALEPEEHWIIGCSGPEQWVADYDDSAEEVSVFTEIVEVDGVEMRYLEITAIFADGSEVSAQVTQPTADPDAE